MGIYYEMQFYRTKLIGHIFLILLLVYGLMNFFIIGLLVNIDIVIVIDVYYEWDADIAIEKELCSKNMLNKLPKSSVCRKIWS